MYVNTYKKVKESIAIHEKETTSTCVNLRSEIKRSFLADTFPADVIITGKKIFWNKKWQNEVEIPYDGIPFVIVGQEELECHQGPDHKKTGKRKESIHSQDADHNYLQKKRRRTIQNTKKMNCPATVKVKVVIKLPQYKVDKNITEWKKRDIALKIKADCESQDLQKEARFYLFFPSIEDHRNHLTGDFAGFNQPPEEKIRKKIKTLALQGIRKVSDIRVFLEQYVSNELFPGLAVSRNNKRYFPSSKTIRNHVYLTLRSTRFSTGDQRNLNNLIETLQHERPDDFFYIRTTDEVSSNDEDDNSEIDEVPQPSGFLFIHQTAWQKRMLSNYGQELCLLDATYNTSKYDLPLFFLCVQTNCGFSICATFITANESKDCIAEALNKVKNSNPEWHPANFLTDFDEREIMAVQEIFEGCSVYLCQFHREQAWDRWLRETKNGVGNYREEIKIRLRNIANSSSQEDYERFVEQLKDTEKWVFAYRRHLVNVRLTTTNGLEKKHQHLKNSYLAHYGDGTLVTLVTTLLNRFLKDSYNEYVHLF